MRTTGDAVLAIPVGPCGPAEASVSLEDYASAAPWPHVVVDGAFDPALIEAAEAEQLRVARDLRPHVSRHLIKAESPEVVGPASEQLMKQLDSEDWVEFLSGLTGIEDLASDPLHFWAGLHVSPVGAFQRVHRDFQKHPATGLYHRVNVLVYLSSGWTPEDGAVLELWSSDAKRCVRTVRPEPGRLVIFESSPTTPHAVSRQSSPDPDRLRLSLASYYYSPQPPPGGLRRLGALIQPRVPGEPLLASFIDVGDALRGARRRAAMLPARARGLMRRSPPSV